MRYRDITFDRATTHRLLKNLCVTLREKGFDYTCEFMEDDICCIECDKYVIDMPTVKETSLFFRVSEYNKALTGFFKANHLLAFLEDTVENENSLCNSSNCNKYHSCAECPYNEG